MADVATRVHQTRRPDAGRARAGFTMAETLAAVAVIAIAGAIAFVSLSGILRSMQQAELDGTAKEIFMAAQNHLSAAGAQGLVAVKSEAGKGEAPPPGGVGEGEGASAADIRFFAVDGAADERLDPMKPASKGSVLYQMLPFGSIDETVRTGGTYVISYDVATATVLDVFYASLRPTSPFGSSTDGVPFKSEDYGNLLDVAGEGEEAVAGRQAFGLSGPPAKTAMIGYYGGGDAGSAPRDAIARPVLRVYDEERLMATVTNPFAGAAQEGDALQLLVTGKTSGNTKCISLPAGDAGVGGAAAAPAQQSSFVVADDTGSAFLVYLDEVTSVPLAAGGFASPGHFADLFGDGGPLPGTGPLIPGEDVEIQAKAFSTGRLANIALSAQATRNSLFDEVDASGGEPVAVVSSIRHLENLARSVSGFDPGDSRWAVSSSVDSTQSRESPSEALTLGIDSAEAGDGVLWRAVQTRDLSWADFRSAAAQPTGVSDKGVLVRGGEGEEAAGPYGEYAESVRVVERGADHADGAAGTFAPIDAPEGLAYDGQSHSIGDVVIEGHALSGASGVVTSGHAGLFSELSAGSVANLELVGFRVGVAPETSGNAGALAGVARQASVSNVLVRDGGEQAGGACEISGSLSAGGLIGSLEGGSVEKCAAAVCVRATGAGSAGGLVGQASDSPTVSESYSGGHTEGGAYGDDANVSSARGAAGGLVGALDGQVRNCYSTCSVRGETAGGLVGSASSGAIEGNAQGSLCYATGRVSGAEGSTIGAIIGKKSPIVSVSGYYFGLVNPDMPAVGSDSEDGSCTQADAATSSYADVCAQSPRRAVPYDLQPIVRYAGIAGREPTLDAAYGSAYPFKTIADMLDDGGEDESAAGRISPLDQLVAHYGDWPVLETLVQNTETAQ